MDAVVDAVERTVTGAVATLLETYRDILVALGERPFGFRTGDRWQQLETYLAVRDNPAAWSALLADRVAIAGQDAAEVITVRETTEFEAMLDRAGGVEGVQAALAMQRLGGAEKAIRAVERIDALPKVIVRPPLPPVDPIGLLTPNVTAEELTPPKTTPLPGPSTGLTMPLEMTPQMPFQGSTGLTMPLDMTPGMSFQGSA